MSRALSVCGCRTRIRTRCAAAADQIPPALHQFLTATNPNTWGNGENFRFQAKSVAVIHGSRPRKFGILRLAEKTSAYNSEFLLKSPKMSSHRIAPFNRTCTIVAWNARHHDHQLSASGRISIITFLSWAAYAMPTSSSVLVRVFPRLDIWVWILAGVQTRSFEISS